MKHLGPHGILTKVVLHGLVLLGASTLGFIVIAFLLIGSALDPEVQSFSAWLGQQACNELSESNRKRSLQGFPAPVAVLDETGRELGSSQGFGAPLPTPNELHTVKQGAPRTTPEFTVVACDDWEQHFAVVGPPAPLLPTGRLLLLVLALFVTVAVGSIPLARSLVRPIRDLSRIAERLGAGELSTRAEVVRRDELGELAFTLNTMAANLERRMLAEKELLANVSHELRTPLSRLRVVVDSARESPARALSLLPEIARDLEELERLADDSLDAIRLDFVTSASTLRLRREALLLGPLLQRAVARSAELYPDRDVELELDSDLPALHLDAALTSRLFDNLLDNARKYSSQPIIVRAMRSAQSVVIEIEDRGIGIDVADLDRIFEPFFRTDRSQMQSGSGIGLSLCRRIVEAHGGKISARSQADIGTVVSVELPVGVQSGSLQQRAPVE